MSRCLSDVVLLAASIATYGIQFYRFPADPNKRHKWTSAVNRDNWTPNEYTWICSEHFVSGVKSANPLAPNYIPTIFKHVKREGMKLKWLNSREGKLLKEEDWKVH